MFNKTITNDNVQKIVQRWNSVIIPTFIQQLMSRNEEKLVSPQLRTIALAKKSKNIDNATIQNTEDNITSNASWASTVGFYLGVDLLSGKLKRKDVNDYINVTTQPIEEFIAEWTGILYVMGVTSEEESIRIAKQVIWQAVQTVNDNLILVIDYSDEILRINPRLRFKKRI